LASTIVSDNRTNFPISLSINFGPIIDIFDIFLLQKGDFLAKLDDF
jgi:hypothetical protein